MTYLLNISHQDRLTDLPELRDKLTIHTAGYHIYFSFMLNNLSQFILRFTKFNVASFEKYPKI